MSNKQGREYIMKVDCCFLVQITAFFMSSEGATFRIAERMDPEYLFLSLFSCLKTGIALPVITLL